MARVEHSRIQTVLITGGAGFIGSHLAESLLTLGKHVLVIDDLSTGSLDNIAHLLEKRGFDFTHASIAETSILGRLASQADVIIHLAAAVGVGLIVDRPVESMEINVAGTEAVLRAALRYHNRVLLASSSEVYGKGIRIPFREEDDLLLSTTGRSRWTYAASKMVGEFMGLAYQHEYDLEIVSFRLFNTIGPRQTGRYGMVVPRFVRQALRGDPITVYGDGCQTRCFCDVRDVIRALIDLGEHPQAIGQIYNIGSGEEVSISELAKRVRSIAQSNVPIVNIPYAEAYVPVFDDIQRRVPDITRIRKLLGWQPRYSLNETLHAVVEYERNLSETERKARDIGFNTAS